MSKVSEGTMIAVNAWQAVQCGKCGDRRVVSVQRGVLPFCFPCADLGSFVRYVSDDQKETD